MQATFSNFRETRDHHICIKKTGLAPFTPLATGCGMHTAALFFQRLRFPDISLFRKHYTRTTLLCLKSDYILYHPYSECNIIHKKCRYQYQYCLYTLHEVFFIFIIKTICITAVTLLSFTPNRASSIFVVIISHTNYYYNIFAAPRLLISSASQSFF